MVNEVLLIDDDPLICQVVGALLGEKGLRLTAVRSGPEGLALLAQRAFDLVLLDVHLPAMNGPEIMRRMNEIMLAPPVIVVTGGGANSPEAQEIMRLGAFGLLEKPFDFATLYGAIGRVLGLPPE